MKQRMSINRLGFILILLLTLNFQLSTSCLSLAWAEAKAGEVGTPLKPPSSAQPAAPASSPPSPEQSVASYTRPSSSVFDYVRPTTAATMQLVAENKLFKKYLVQFPSALVTQYSQSTTISAMYYVPQGKTHFPVVIILPHISGAMAAERYTAQGLLRAGFGVLHITEPYYFPFAKFHDSWLESAKDLQDLVHVVHLLRQAVINARQGIDWVSQQPGVDKDRIGLMGISMGGWIGVLVAGVDPRIKSCVYALAGGDMSELVLQSRLTGPLRNGLREHGVSIEDIQVVSNVIDPLSVAQAAKRAKTLMLNASFDKTVPHGCTERLWEALGEPPIFWLPVGHATANLFRWYIRQKVTQHFISTLQ